MRLLILGGTSEAATLGARLARRGDVRAVLSLAGRTTSPVRSPLPTRTGGFGGVEGLRAYLRDERIDAVIDATHPFAAQMSHHAALACAAQRVALLSFTRPPWERVGGDAWIEVPDMAGAVAALGAPPRRVLLTHGRLQLAAFAQAPQHHYVVRAIEPPEGLDALPRHRLILARGPFDREAEEALMHDERIETLVSKNSGGAATYGKIEAARRLSIPVIMLARPLLLNVERTYDLPRALQWIDHRAAS